MSIKSVRDKIVEIVESVAPSTQFGLRGARKFKHRQRPSGVDDTALPDNGGFWVELSGPAGLRPIPISALHPRRVQYEWTLNIAYRQSSDSEAVDIAIAEDFASLSAAIVSPLNWAANSTGIVQLGRGDPILTANISEVQGGKLLQIKIPSEVEP